MRFDQDTPVGGEIAVARRRRPSDCTPWILTHGVGFASGRDRTRGDDCHRVFLEEHGVALDAAEVGMDVRPKGPIGSRCLPLRLGRSPTNTEILCSPGTHDGARTDSFLPPGAKRIPSSAPWMDLESPAPNELVAGSAHRASLRSGEHGFERKPPAPSPSSSACHRNLSPPPLHW